MILVMLKNTAIYKKKKTQISKTIKNSNLSTENF